MIIYPCKKRKRYQPALPCDIKITSFIWRPSYDQISYKKHHLAWLQSLEKKKKKKIQLILWFDLKP